MALTVILKMAVKAIHRTCEPREEQMDGWSNGWTFFCIFSKGYCGIGELWDLTLDYAYLVGEKKYCLFQTSLRKSLKHSEPNPTGRMWKFPKAGKVKEKDIGKVNESKSEEICSWCNGIMSTEPLHIYSINIIYELQPIEQQGETKRRLQTGYIPGGHFLQHWSLTSYWVVGSHKP